MYVEAAFKIVSSLIYVEAWHAYDPGEQRSDYHGEVDVGIDAFGSRAV